MPVIYQTPLSNLDIWQGLYSPGLMTLQEAESAKYIPSRTASVLWKQLTSPNTCDVFLAFLLHLFLSLLPTLELLDAPRSL